MPSGVYRLESIVNPSGRLVTERDARGRASIRIRIDKANDRVSVLR